MKQRIIPFAEINSATLCAFCFIYFFFSDTKLQLDEKRIFWHQASPYHCILFQSNFVETHTHTRAHIQHIQIHTHLVHLVWLLFLEIKLKQSDNTFCSFHTLSIVQATQQSHRDTIQLASTLSIVLTSDVIFLLSSVCFLLVLPANFPVFISI